MHSRTFPGCITVVTLILSILILVSGCVQKEAPVPVTETPTVRGGTVCDLPHNGSQLLFSEARRELGQKNSSSYSHTTCVDEGNGTYNYDCSGFVGYALNRADPCAFRALLAILPGHDNRPEAGDFYLGFTNLGTRPGTGAWMRVASVSDLRPGDIIAWLRPDSSDAKSTGHVMIVAGTPAGNPERDGEFLIRVIDATSSPHAGDTRPPGQGGLGEGTIGIMADSSGRPVCYYWDGGESETCQKTEIAFARIA